MSFGVVFHKPNKFTRLTCFCLVGKVCVIFFSCHSGNKEKIHGPRGGWGGGRRRGREVVLGEEDEEEEKEEG